MELRIAYSPNFGYADVELEIAVLVKAAVDIFTKLDTVVEEVDPGFANPHSIFQTLSQAVTAKLLHGFMLYFRRSATPKISLISPSPVTNASAIAAY
ncbi:hypothetical protein [Nostoc sp.]|uniref:hypothetical protein n=1 Tax=Nostoc sp. TaxID=1180 RepID=UPI002FF5974D